MNTNNSENGSAWSNALGERARLVRFRLHKERFRLREEFRLIPRRFLQILLILYIVAMIIAQIVISFPGNEPFSEYTPLLNGLAMAGMVTGASIPFALILCLIAYVNRDAQRRGMNAGLWTLIVSVMLPAYLAIGFIIYFLIREPLPYACPRCGHLVSARHNYCAACQHNLRPSCPQCRREVSADDRFCPHCALQLKDHAA